MKRLCIVVTTDLIVRFFLHQLLRDLGGRYEVTLVVNTSDRELLRDSGIRVEVRPTRIERRIAPLADLAALGNLFALFRRRRFDGVVSLGPKAGLLAALAARIARVPFRCHVFQGEVWATRTGAFRAMLRCLDRLVVRLSSEVLVISRSEREFLAREGVLHPGRGQLIANGSLAGVDLDRFRPDAAWRREAREALEVPQEALLVLFLGRLTRDKGVLDLARAFRAIAAEVPQAYLAFVGPDEEELQQPIWQAAGEHAGRLRRAGLTDVPEHYIAAADVVALPSYREGFGNVLIEAAAAGVPALASRVYGIEDAMVDGETGLTHSPADLEGIAQGLRRLLTDRGLREKLGARGRDRVKREFSSERVVKFWADWLAQRV